MKQFIKYRFFSKSIICLFLVSQLWINMASYCYWLSDSDSELVELFSSGDSESEDEDNEKEKDDKFPIYLYTAKLNIQKKIINILHSDDVRSMHYPETTTPPPKV